MPEETRRQKRRKSWLQKEEEEEEKMVGCATAENRKTELPGGKKIRAWKKLLKKTHC